VAATWRTSGGRRPLWPLARDPRSTGIRFPRLRHFPRGSPHRRERHSYDVRFAAPAGKPGLR